MKKGSIVKNSMILSTQTKSHLNFLNKELSKRDPTNLKTAINIPITMNSYSNIWLHRSAIEILSNSILTNVNKIIKIFQQNKKHRLSDNNLKLMLTVYSNIFGIHEFLFIGLDLTKCLSGTNLLCYCAKGKQLSVIYIYCILCISIYFNIYLSNTLEVLMSGNTNTNVNSNSNANTNTNICSNIKYR